MTYERLVIAGQSVFDKLQALKKNTVLPSGKTPGTFDSEILCKFQQLISQRGYIEAEIVETNYGFSVRYASGLQNFGLIASSRAKQVDGSFESAEAFAIAWQAHDPDRRYVTYFKTVS